MLHFVIVLIVIQSACSFSAMQFRLRALTLQKFRVSKRVFSNVGLFSTVRDSHRQKLHSPSDLMVYMQSPFASWLDRLYKEHPDHEWFSQHCGPDQNKMLNMLSEMGTDVEENVLRKEFAGEIVSLKRKDGVSATSAAMEKGVDVIYQAPLCANGFRGIADFVVKLPDGTYEVWDAKLAKHVKPQYVVQLCCYSEMLATLQGGQMPSRSCLVLNGATSVTPLQLSSYLPFYRSLKNRFLQFHEKFDPLSPPALPLLGESVGRWESSLKSLLVHRDDVSLVAGVGRREADSLREVGVHTTQALAKLSPNAIFEKAKKCGIEGPLLTRLSRQAKLQNKEGRIPAWEYLDGFSASRLKEMMHDECTEGDVYFDLEGNPFTSQSDGSLTSREYLWGVSVHKLTSQDDVFGAQVVKTDIGYYLAWWGHDEKGEAAAFTGFMKWLQQRLLKHPSLHVYHYGAYEVSAMKRLAGRTGKCEDILDDCLRRGVFVDIYTALRRCLLVGEPKYSIKNTEKLWRSGSRDSDGVAKGDDSIIAYRHWTEFDGNLESAELESIRKYNQEDCDSTLEGVLWLRSVAATASGAHPKTVVDSLSDEVEHVEEMIEEPLAELLLESKLDNNVKDVMIGALEFERRELKPMWWRRFAWLGASDSELEVDDDAMMINRVQPESKLYVEPYKLRPRKKKMCYTYAFSDTQALSTVAMRALVAKDGGTAGADYSSLLAIVSESDCAVEASDWLREVPLRVSIVDINLSTGVVVVEMNPTSSPPNILTLIPDEFVNPEPIPTAVREVVREWVTLPIDVVQTDPVYQLLSKQPPISTLRTHPKGLLQAASQSSDQDMNSCEDGRAILNAVTKAAANLASGSYLPIQGPPGTGKTTAGALIIADAVARGERVAVTANSHKVITNMLAKTAQLLSERNMECGIVKIGGSYQGDVAVIGHNARGVVGASSSKLQETDLLVGATVWALSHDNLSTTVDLLVVDEAGQVPISRLPAMGRCLKNGGRLVVLGDQMQLAAPLQASHPGESHLSILEYVLSDSKSEAATQAVMKPDRGIFLPLTFRLHPKICSFISSHVYNNRLRPHSSNFERCLELLSNKDDRLIRVNSGVVTVSVEHEFNTVSSEEEVLKVVQIVEELCNPDATLLKDTNISRPLHIDDILVVAPFNIQVKKLASALQKSARVGTVDKFQGQESPVVILSLCRSSLDDTSGAVMEFLLDMRRMNVALSRAQVCAIVVMSPQLSMAIPKSLPQMKAVSFACRLLEAEK